MSDSFSGGKNDGCLEGIVGFFLFHLARNGHSFTISPALQGFELCVAALEGASVRGLEDIEFESFPLRLEAMVPPCVAHTVCTFV